MAKKPSEFVVATLNLYDVSFISAKMRKLLCQWLRGYADAIEANTKPMSSRFRAELIGIGKRKFREKRIYSGTSGTVCQHCE